MGWYVNMLAMPSQDDLLLVLFFVGSFVMDNKCLFCITKAESKFQQHNLTYQLKTLLFT